MINPAVRSPLTLTVSARGKILLISLLAALNVMLIGPAVAEDREWQPLWDGKSLTGWHVIGKGDWRVEQGAIHGTHAKSEPAYGHLVTDRSYGDFTVRLKFKCLSGNSGFYFRIEEKGFSGVSGFQAEIDPVKDVGGLYETNGRQWVVQPTPGQVATWFKPGEWNEMVVSARGGHIIVQINGRKSAELTDDSGRREGKLALQLHGNDAGDVWFKDIEIRQP